MYVSIPNGVLPGGVISAEIFASDETLRVFQIHPGDEVSCIGFPLGAESKPSGFPVLRTGRIASYPILPTSETEVFLLDFPVFPGNSGGPSYIVFSGVRGTKLYTSESIAILGLVSKEQVYLGRIPLGIAEVVHASLISETIKLLPDPKE